MNRNFAGPVRKTTDTNTMQIESVATKVGTAISEALSRIACVSGLPACRLR